MLEGYWKVVKERGIYRGKIANSIHELILLLIS
jgi:hypothetical protein